jgi:hypothetical protein
LAKLWEVSWLNADVRHEFILNHISSLWDAGFCGAVASQVFCCLATWPKLLSSYLFLT